MERLLILNPGSTSTKLAVFDGEEPLFVESITHSAEELAPFDCVADQYEFRRELVLDCLKRHSVPLDSLTAIVSRGGLLTPIERGPTSQRRHGVAAQEQAPERARLQRGRDDRPFHQPPAWHPRLYLRWGHGGRAAAH